MNRRFTILVLALALLPCASMAQLFMVYEHGQDRTAVANGGSVAMTAASIGAEDAGKVVFT